MSDSRWKLGEGSGDGKRLSVDGPLPLIIDNDDVDTSAVAILVERVVEVLAEHWSPVFGDRCENDDCRAGWEWARATTSVPGTCASCGGSLVRAEIAIAW